MSIDTRHIVELIGGLAIVISLVFVGLELRQANVIAGRESRTEMSIEAIDLNRLTLEDASTASLRVKLRDLPANLTDEEAEQALALAWMYVWFWAAINSSVEAGLVPDEVVSIYTENVRLVFQNYPGLCPFISITAPESAKLANFRFYNEIYSELEFLGCQKWTF